MISQFDILAISEHSLFEEQLGILKSATDNTKNFHAVSANDNPCIISGEKAHGGVALLWKTSFDDYITPIENTECDHIVGIKCKFPRCKPLFILSVYMPSSNHALDEYREYLDFLWALYDSLSADSFVFVMGDLNGDLGNSLGDKGLKEPNESGKLLLDFANYFNLCPINLLTICNGPLETYFSHCEKYRSTIDCTFLPDCLQNSILMSKTFDLDIDNTSDHQPVIAKLDFSIPDVMHGQHCPNSTTKQKIHWSNISQETVNVRYVDPLLSDISELNIPSSIEPTALTETITDLLLKNSLSLVSLRPFCNKKHKHGVYVSLPDEVKNSRTLCKEAFASWKQIEFSVESSEHDFYRAKRRDYHSSLRKFLNQLECDRIKKLCSAADSDEKLFWKLLKGQKSSQMGAFLINGSLVTDKTAIRNIWADHFEALGTPSANLNFDNDFAVRVSTHVKEILEHCLHNSMGILNEPLSSKEVANVCSKLKPGVSGVLLDYEHIRYAGPPLLELLFELYQSFIQTFSALKSLKTGIILPSFKGKGIKANDKNNYRDITLFPTLCKIYEMILLNRLEKFAVDKGYFSQLQFGFSEGVGCIEASLTILETINHMLEQGSKVFGCFLDVRKAFDTV